MRYRTKRIGVVAQALRAATARLVAITALGMGLCGVAAAQDCREHFLGGQAPVAMRAAMAQSTQILCYSGFAAGSSSLTLTGVWSAEHLTKERLELARGVGRADCVFHPDPGLQPGKRGELRFFVGSRRDRGHLSPAGDMPNARAVYESCSLGQMVPQDPDNNRVLWEGIESSTRRLVMKIGEAYVITGPLFVGPQLYSLGGGMLVPTDMFKAIYLPTLGKASVYVTPNAPGMAYRVITVAEAEQASGFNLFPAMPGSVKTTLISLPAPTPYGQRNRT